MSEDTKTVAIGHRQITADYRTNTVSIGNNDSCRVKTFTTKTREETRAVANAAVKIARELDKSKDPFGDWDYFVHVVVNTLAGRCGDGCCGTGLDSPMTPEATALDRAGRLFR